MQLHNNKNSVTKMGMKEEDRLILMAKRVLEKNRQSSPIGVDT